MAGTGINTFNLTDSFVRNNHSHDNTGGGILVEDSTNVLVEGNMISSNNVDATTEEWWDAGIWVDGGKDITVRNNTLSNHNGPAIEIRDESNQLPTGYVVENNTITDNVYAFYVWNFSTEALPPEDVLRLTGNTITGSSVQDSLIVAYAMSA